MTAAPRVAPGGLGELGLVNWLICRAIARGAGTREARLFATLGRHRRLFRRWLGFAAVLMPGGALPRRDTELCILRVAEVRGSAYERAHHQRLGRRAGLTTEELARVAAGPAAAGWSARDLALLAATDALLATHDLDDTTWSALRHHLDERQAVELCLLVGHYDMLAATIAALRIVPDEPRQAAEAG